MEFIELSKEKIIKLLANKKNYYDNGAYGILINYDDTTLIKLYYKDIFGTYTTLNSETLDKEINILLEVDKEMNEFNLNYTSKLQHLKEIYKTLIKTKSNSLIKGIAMYKGYPIGILLEKYKNYIKLSQVYKNLNKQDKIQVLEKVKELMFDLFNNNIFPTDIKENNILINPDNLDIKLIDLDGHETRIETENYIKKYPHIKNYCINKFEQMSIRILK